MAQDWIAGLRPDVRPLQLATQYPRLINLIAAVWNSPAVTSTLLTDLLNEARGDSDGIPEEVLDELRGLHDHYFKAALAERVMFREFELMAAGEIRDRRPANDCETTAKRVRCRQREDGRT